MKPKIVVLVVAGALLIYLALNAWVFHTELRQLATVPVELPKERFPIESSPSTEVRIVVLSPTKCTVDGQPVDIAQVKARLAAKKAAGKTSVSMKFSSDVPLHVLSDLMEANAGFDRVTIDDRDQDPSAAKAALGEKKSLYLNVVERLKRGGLDIPPSGVVQLPQEFRTASVDGEVDISRPSHDQMLVLFKTWRGKGSDLEGYLYAEKPLTEKDMPEDENGYRSISINTSDVDLETDAKTQIPHPKTRRINPNVGRILDDNWYEVFFRMD